MPPSAYEIDEVGNAFISISYLDYTNEERNQLNRFLHQHGKAFDEDGIKTAFKTKPEIIQAIRTLHQFATQYENEKEIFSEFKEEIDHLLITINQAEGGLIL